MDKGVRNPCVKRRPADKRQTSHVLQRRLIVFWRLAGPVFTGHDFTHVSHPREPLFCTVRSAEKQNRNDLTQRRSTMQENLANAVAVYDGQPCTTSLKIAEVFGKAHRSVLGNSRPQFWGQRSPGRFRPAEF